MIYVLAVGINRYSADEVPNLSGPVNDIDRFTGFLEEVLPTGEVEVKRLENHQAKRDNIIQGFDHLKQAGKGDTAIFYFSGHGSRQQSAPEFKPYSTDGLEETLVCFDSRYNGNPDLADKELAALMAEVHSRGPDIIAFMDNCHSGSTFRAIEQASHFVPKLAPQSFFSRELSDYYGHQSFFRDHVFAYPEYSMLAFTACSYLEKALEDAKRYEGVFSKALLSLLQQLYGNDQLTGVSYADLFFKLRHKIRHYVSNQTPQLDIYGGFDSNKVFLGGNRVKISKNYRVYYSKDNKQWMLSAGAIHGIQSDELTLSRGRVHLYDQQDKEVKEVGQFKAIRLQDSVLALGLEPAEHIFQAHLSGVLIDRLPIGLTLEEGMSREIIAELEEKSGFRTFSLELEAPTVKYQVYVNPHGYRIENTRSQGVLIESNFKCGEQWTRTRYQFLAVQLNKIAYWERIWNLRNRHKHIDYASLWDKDISVQVNVASHGNWVQREAETELDLDFASEPGKEESSYNLVRMELSNQSAREVKALLLYMQQDMAIKVVNTTETVGPNSSLILFEYGIGIKDTVRFESVDLLKIIIADKDQSIDGFMFTQSPLAFRRKSLNMRSLIKPLHKHLWTTKHLIVRTVRTIGLFEGKAASFLEGKINIHAHPVFRASLGLRTGTAPVRSMDQAILLRSWANSMGYRSASIVTTDYEDLPILEFSSFSGTESVTPQDPLIVDLAIAVAEDHWVVPLIYDGAAIHSLGICEPLPDPNQVRIRINRFPELRAALVMHVHRIPVLFIQVEKNQLSQFGMELPE